MFQSFKRAKYISQNNFHHWSTQDGVRMHLWLQKNGWPANEFVDWFMRVYPNTTDSSQLSFKIFMTDQFDWVSDNSVDALNSLYERIIGEEFQIQDKNNLTRWLNTIYDDSKK